MFTVVCWVGTIPSNKSLNIFYFYITLLLIGKCKLDPFTKYITTLFTNISILIKLSMTVLMQFTLKVEGFEVSDSPL
jgi:hypothetical protein